jgi:hypothetical protein
MPKRFSSGSLRSTGIEVKPVFDNESAKTMGLVKRLMAEQIQPVCDVFWSNEAMAARKLIRGKCGRRL